jgi:hypothetical protein
MMLAVHFTLSSVNPERVLRFEQANSAKYLSITGALIKAGKCATNANRIPTERWVDRTAIEKDLSEISAATATGTTVIGAL